MAQLADFEALLHASIGLDAASIGSSAIARAVKERQSVLNLHDLSRYWDHVQSSEMERQALIETVVVPETWFFRDREAFLALAHLAHEHSRRMPTRALRLLSLPSSTGEEPYSMAMALLDAGVPADRFRIDAVDISARSLARAGRAVYSKNSFRGTDLSFRARYFEQMPDGYRLREVVRRQVHFQQGNLFAPDFLPGREIYDVVFCRNLLIYFDPATQHRAFDILERLLTVAGTLFVGPSETALPLHHDLVSAKIALAFAFRSKAGTERLTTNAAARPVVRFPAARQAVASSTSYSAKGSPLSVDVAKPLEILDRARQLADHARFDEAAECCAEFLRGHAATADVFYLLGLMRDAAGDQQEASAFYRKALYLDPSHQDTLIHLAFLVEQEGNDQDAHMLRERARRSEQSGGA